LQDADGFQLFIEWLDHQQLYSLPDT
jgi:hypothetical protein